MRTRHIGAERHALDESGEFIAPVNRGFSRKFASATFRSGSPHIHPANEPDLHVYEHDIGRRITVPGYRDGVAISRERASAMRSCRLRQAPWLGDRTDLADW